MSTPTTLLAFDVGARRIAKIQYEDVPGCRIGYEVDGVLP